jgi:hypothetical protein
MKYLVLAFIFVSCVNKNEHLHARVVTDKQGCEYLVATGLGDTTFLYKIKDKPCADANE